jgi:hypothetical protein
MNHAVRADSSSSRDITGNSHFVRFRFSQFCFNAI